MKQEGEKWSQEKEEEEEDDCKPAWTSTFRIS